MVVPAPSFKENIVSIEEHFQYEEQEDKPMVLIPYGLMALSGFVVGLAIGLFIGHASPA